MDLSLSARERGKKSDINCSSLFLSGQCPLFIQYKTTAYSLRLLEKSSEIYTSYSLSFARAAISDSWSCDPFVTYRPLLPHLRKYLINLKTHSSFSFRNKKTSSHFHFIVMS